ncbi:hypothetical protein NQ317_019671 [Molorchus minor]|uniref:PDZ domain-containing protein n=1 Tax=Molorchus minor TaxID=1323400 RepID=A0ABQ9JKM4_9CUCU|nr:hypothetical protein NQ317_019671 [Molorchus minor]
MGRIHEVALTLRRSFPNESWGFSLVGGADVKTPLIVTKVGFGSPADGVLQRGDIITKVGNYDARDIRHQDAQTLFKNAGNNVRVVVQRENTPRVNSTGSSVNSSHNYSPLSVSPHLSPRGPGSAPLGYSPGGSALTPYYSYPFENILNSMTMAHRSRIMVKIFMSLNRQPGPTESYLRHHPNPSVRAPPHHLDTDQLIKQKVAFTVLDRIATGDPNKQLVHKQFNSPINLYSEPNVVDTIHKQTGIQPQIQVRKHVKFNPAESETYKALQEESAGDYVQEENVAPQSKIYAPNRTIPGKKPAFVVNQNPSYTTAIGGDPDMIQQSGSFKRLMMSVLPGSNF